MKIRLKSAIKNQFDRDRGKKIPARSKQPTTSVLPILRTRWSLEKERDDGEPTGSGLHLEIVTMCGGDADRPGSPKSPPATGKQKTIGIRFDSFFSSSASSSSSVRRIFYFYFWIFWKFQIMMGDVARRTLPNDATGRFRPCCWPGSSIFHIDKTFSLQLQYTKSFLIFIFTFLFNIYRRPTRQGEVCAYSGGLFPELCGSNFVVSQPDVEAKKKNPVKWVSDSLKMMTVLD